MSEAFSGRVEEIVYKEGWSDTTLLALALEFISGQPSEEAFLAFLESRKSLPPDADESMSDECEGFDCERCGGDGCHMEPDDSPDESMDGDHESALASAGMGTDEDYGYFGDGGDEF